MPPRKRTAELHRSPGVEAISVADGGSTIAICHHATRTDEWFVWDTANPSAIIECRDADDAAGTLKNIVKRGRADV